MPSLNLLALLLLVFVTAGDVGLWRTVPRLWRDGDPRRALLVGALLSGSLLAVGCVAAGDPFTVLVAWFAAVQLSILASEVSSAEPAPRPQQGTPAD